MVGILFLLGLNRLFLETSSSFGSSSSSDSSTNFLTIKTQVEESEANLRVRLICRNVKLRCPLKIRLQVVVLLQLASVISHQHTISYHDVVAHVSLMKNRIDLLQCNMRVNPLIFPMGSKKLKQLLMLGTHHIHN
ncbi:hypothetical protein O6P43_005643 [Quillaja saponaria]|uniref:Uncharacterized protein n=1 Tax=Quillaja saponaria TaxID=32244 RepID=A0AAD7VH96_QUISA|nr:hypothetical protein O6P43_005643 [Quillaja saponaria]